ncbi:S-adenosyl-L-methionine-dependent methyltransferase [Trichophaea hybrida]|nr:S-adenosyl-L-methionine-dependent methyltransferase [Trichophaea hybrida]
MSDPNPPTCSSSSTVAVSLGSESYETAHVHEVYQHIAPHFSATRFKPWPIVERFLREMPTGSVGLDVGCGNGKYLTVNPNVYMIGSDRSVARSSNLIGIAHERKTHESFVADALDLPHPEARFDFAISIAVIHHFSSSERRIASIKSILATLKKGTPDQNVPGGRALIYVWALEQKNSRRGWDEGHAQDVFVPWVLSKQYSKSNTSKDAMELQETPQETNAKTPKEAIYQRYYHLYRKGELEADVVAAGGCVLESGYEKDNWWVICNNLTS